MTIAEIRKHLENGGTLVEREHREDGKPEGWQQYRLQDINVLSDFLDIVALRSASGNWIYKLT